MKPLIDRSDFDRLEIRVGTVVEIRRLDSLNLVSADVDAGERVAALLINRVASSLGVGSQVLVAVGLHPLRAKGETHTAFVIAILSDEAALNPGIRVS
jgi:tRNA-binding EMAP/Myf-like protein